MAVGQAPVMWLFMEPLRERERERLGDTEACVPIVYVCVISSLTLHCTLDTHTGGKNRTKQR